MGNGKQPLCAYLVLVKELSVVAVSTESLDVEVCEARVLVDA